MERHHPNPTHLGAQPVIEHLFIAGPAAWNRIVYLDRLPEPVPHMQFALDEYETVGGTSAGRKSVV